MFTCDSENVRGKIKSVYCKNFVTYTECTFHPTEYLNVIIGPNGTGKSTLVAAIVLGLGGKPELLSRALSVGDYVKNGRDEAAIKIEIIRDNVDETMFFERHFARNGKSKYLVNGDTVAEKRFLSIIAEYKIQINNLCQFLPQDRVQDFAKMNPQTIFINTIKSVCSEEVLSSFEELKEFRSKQKSGTDTVKKSKEKLEELLGQCQTLQRGMQLYNEQQEIKNKLDVCEAKKLQLEARALKEKLKEQNKDKKIAENKYKELQDAHNSIMRRQSDITKTAQNLGKLSGQKRKQEEEIATRKNENMEKIKNLIERIHQENITYEKNKREKVEYDKTLRTETNVLEILVEDFKKAKEDLSINKNWENELKQCEYKLQNLKEEACEIARQRTQLNSKLDEFAPDIGLLKRRIERAQNIKEQKLQAMRDQFSDIYRAVHWLAENRHLFKGKVYDPMILELNVRDPSHAKYIENTINNRDLLSFTCENKEDISLLVNELRIKQKILINVGHASAATEVLYTPPEPIESLRRFGFQAYLIQLIEGPPAILNYLCKLNHLHRIPIGTEEVNNHTDEIPSRISLYFGGDQRYSANVSKYTGELSVLQNQIRGKNLLTSRNDSEIKQCEKRLAELTKNTDRLKNRRTELETKINEIQVKREEIGSQKRLLMEKYAASSQLEAKVKRQKEKVLRLKENATSLQDLQEKFKTKLKNLFTNIMQLQIGKVEILKKLEYIAFERKAAETKERIFQQENENLINEAREANDAKNDALRMLETVKKAVEKTQQTYNTKCSEAKQAEKKCNSTELFHLLPDTLDELKESLNEFKARLECMGDVDREVVKDYEQKCAEVEKLKQTIQISEHDHIDVAQKIETLHNNWFPEIERVVTTLNDHFGEFMGSMDYVGEVNLIRQDEHDYDTYGIQIMVQYRSNTMLQALDRHVQSGGERAVAIATYTLSLQHLTHVPFRCVDEINQGMDARNERKIFEMIVKETTQRGRAQYFFITPKLLTNLTYNDRMSVHIVFNGKTVESSEVFSNYS